MQKKPKYFVKHIMYFVIFYSGLLNFLVILLKHFRKHHYGVILFYHRFGENEKKKILPYLEIREFEKQVTHLKRLYKFISMEEITSILINKEHFSEPSVAITMDDGYRDNYSLAFPVLRQHGIPFMIYLTAGTIGTDSGLWVDDIEFALNHTRAEIFRCQELLGDSVFNISTYHGKKEVLKLIFTALLRKNNPERRYFIEKLFQILGIDRASLKTKKRVMLNWKEIAEMSKGGVSFGAHTLSHPFLPGIPLEIAKYEIEHSKDLIQRNIGKPVSHFAIPNGKKEDFTDELKELCKEKGFDTIVTTEPGVINSMADRFALGRVLPPPPLHYFACEIARYFFFPKSIKTRPQHSNSNI